MCFHIFYNVTSYIISCRSKWKWICELKKRDHTPATIPSPTNGFATLTKVLSNLSTLSFNFLNCKKTIKILLISIKSLLCVRQLSWAFSLVLTHLILIITQEVGFIIIHALQIRKLRHRRLNQVTEPWVDVLRAKQDRIIPKPIACPPSQATSRDDFKIVSCFLETPLLQSSHIAGTKKI